MVENHSSHIREKIDIRPLKKWCTKNYRKGSLLRETILRENDHLTIEEFQAKMETWLTLLDIEKNHLRITG